MLEKLYSLFILILIIVVSIILSNFFDWSTSIFVALAIVLAIPPFLNIFYFIPKKLKNLPDVDAMPDEILNSKGVTSWETDFCNDINQKFQNEEFIKNISRKQNQQNSSIKTLRINNKTTFIQFYQIIPFF